MKRIAMLAGAALMGAMGSLGNMAILEAAPTVRSPVPPKKRISKSGKRRIGRSKYMPHIGKKEQERAKRCWMSMLLNEAAVARWQDSGMLVSPELCHERAAPTLCQMSKSQYALIQAEDRESIRYA